MNYAGDEDRRRVLLEEFKEAGHLHRLHVGLMFGQITVFLGASGALMHRVVGHPPLEEFSLRLFAVIGGFLAILFLVLHERVYAYSHGARKRAEELQQLLELSLYKHHETQFFPVRRLKAAGMTRALYTASLACWLVILFHPSIIESKPATTPIPAVKH